MKFIFTKKFKELYKDLPSAIQKKFDKQLELMSKNIHYPSLHTKKIQGHPYVWEARVDYHHRFTFNWTNEGIILRTIGAHNEVLRNP